MSILLLQTLTLRASRWVNRGQGEAKKKKSRWELTDPGITDTSASTWFAGVGLHEPLAEDLVGFARLSLVGTDVDATAIGTEYTLSETNLVYSAGVRYLAKDRLELSVIGLLAADSGARLNIEASALYRVQPDIAIGLVSTLPGRDEDGDSLGLGLRWYF